VPTAMVRVATPGRDFALRLIAWSLALFGLLRLPWVALHVLLPGTQMQAAAGSFLLGAPALPIEATLACSGADALALCLGAVLAYPVAWRWRAAGAAGGAALIVGLNVLRIGTLGRAAGSPAWFDTLHLFVWPAILTLAIAGYVFSWMRMADRPRPADAIQPPSAPAQPSRRFIILSAVFLIVFVAISPVYLESGAVLALARFVATSAAAILGMCGVPAHAADNALWTARGGFVVTQECVSTPLIPVYLAAVGAYARTWQRMAAGVAATVPLFTALGILRLLVVALPGLVASPLFLVHAFYQLLLGAVLVVIAALWAHERHAAFGYAAAGLAAAGLFVFTFGPFYTRLISWPAGVPAADPQGALALLPAFQIGLYLALSTTMMRRLGRQRFLAGLVLLGLTQVAGLVMLHALAVHAGLSAHVRDIRGWAVAGPLFIFLAVVNIGRTRD
jgi:exosortase/archaeosortase family protein